VINGAILIFVLSAANSDLYIGSRTLYGLAVEGKAPAIFKKVNNHGVPWPALILCTAFCGLVFLNVASNGSKGMHGKQLTCRTCWKLTGVATVFGWFVNLVSTFGALTWMTILYSHM
jgi:yeast amino acid transporter